jgi:hypothetical protein
MFGGVVDVAGQIRRWQRRHRDALFGILFPS